MERNLLRRFLTGKPNAARPHGARLIGAILVPALALSTVGFTSDAEQEVPDVPEIALEIGGVWNPALGDPPDTGEQDFQGIDTLPSVPSLRDAACQQTGTGCSQLVDQNIDYKYGSCGGSWFYLWDAGNNLAGGQFGANSTRGAIIKAEWGIYIKNSYGWKWTKAGSNWPFNTYWKRDFQKTVPRHAYYKGALAYLKVYTSHGYICYGLVPTHSAWID